MDDFVIVSALRTPIGKFGGSLREINSGTLASIVVKEAISKAGIEMKQVDEVIMGEVRQSTESSNVARVASLRAGLPETVPAFTVNRLCASGMQAIGSAVQQIVMGHARVVVAGGTENMSRAPIYLRNSRFGEGNPQLVDSNIEPGQQPNEIYGDNLGMGITAENVAKKFAISRSDQDLFALRSQQQAAVAISSGKFLQEIIPVEVKSKKSSSLFQQDEFPKQTSIGELEALKPVFKKDGSVTAGNACGRNDGAAAVVITTRSVAAAHGLTPLARIVDWAAVGVSPELMGIGPVPAVKQILARSKLSLQDINLIELNEAFAAQALAVIHELDLNEEILNVNGGAIALGHPVGATGARIVVSLIHELIKRKQQFGLATLCVGGGQGMAMLIEAQ